MGFEAARWPTAESSMGGPSIWPPSPDAEVRLIKRDTHAWDIAYEGHSIALTDVLDTARNHSKCPVEYARAWSLLGRLAWSKAEVEEFVDALHDKRYSCLDGELNPLLAALAVCHGAAIARLFPDVVDSEIVALCGQAGVAAAEHELSSGSPQRRGDAAFAMASLSEIGLPVNRTLVLEALARERDTDTLHVLQKVAEDLRTSDRADLATGGER